MSQFFNDSPVVRQKVQAESTSSEKALLLKLYNEELARSQENMSKIATISSKASRLEMVSVIAIAIALVEAIGLLWMWFHFHQ